MQRPDTLVLGVVTPEFLGIYCTILVANISSWWIFNDIFKHLEIKNTILKGRVFTN